MIVLHFLYLCFSIAGGKTEDSDTHTLFHVSISCTMSHFMRNLMKLDIPLCKVVDIMT
jgi:hypothetical protein